MYLYLLIWRADDEKRLSTIFLIYLIIQKKIELYSNRKKMMIDEALAEVVTTLPQKLPFYESIFDLQMQGETYESIQVYLYEDCLCFTLQKQQPTHLRVNFSFDLIFQLLRNTQIEENAGNYSEFYGFKFERFEKVLVLKRFVFRTDLLLMKKYLELKLNQRGFHELFKPIKKIGKGNFASVYLVIKYEDSKKYAVKAFSKQGSYSEEKGKESLINQIEIMRKFNHKNLMKLYGVYQSQNSIYVSVQLLEGGQLCDKIKNRHKFTSFEIKTVMKGILQGLEIMHAHNIMHRDLKPQNILLRKESDYDCVIADFGLAESAANQPYLFVRCGTPGYVAPEVVNLKDLKAKYDPICDLFSVGVIFHMLVLRKSPFPGREYNQVLAQNRECNINFTLSEYMNLPESWLDLMKRLLEKDPKKRITATEALNHQFFSKDTCFASFTKERNSHCQLINLSKQKEGMIEQCQSPLMTTKNNSRKNPNLLKDDSCLKFKMKQNLMTGRTDQNGQTVEEIDSPGVKERVTRGTVASRFKRMAK